MMNIMIKQKAVYLLCFMMLILTGCWNRIEINDLAIVTGIGIDKGDNGEIELSVQIIIPKGQNVGQEGKSTIVEVGTGKTITDAISKIQQKISRTLFMGHNSVFFISEEIAKEGISNYIDVFARHPFKRLRTYLFVTKNKAVDLLKVTPDLERSSSEVAREFVKSKTVMSVTIKDVLQMLEVKGRGAALPILKLDEEQPDPGNLAMSGTAIFNNGKLVGQIGNGMTRGVLWLRNEIERARITIEPKEGEGMITFQILNANSQLIPKIERGNWKIIVKSKSLDDVIENNSNLNVMNPEIAEKLENQMEKEIDKRIYSVLEYVQKELQSDIFGFDVVFRRHYPEEWEKYKDNWPEKFAEIEVEVQSTVEIERPGRSTLPQGIPDEEVIR